MISLKDKVVIITGANNPQGIGAATTIALAKGCSDCFSSDAAIFIVERCGLYLNIVALEKIFYRIVDSVGVDIAHTLVVFFVVVFVPDSNPHTCLLKG